MLLVIGDQVVKREAVVTRDEVDDFLGFALLVAVNLRAAEKSVGYARRCILFGPKEGADIVAKPPVPLLPTVANEAAHLIQPACVPGFGNELRSRQGRVRLDIPEDWGVRH